MESLVCLLIRNMHIKSLNLHLSLVQKNTLKIQKHKFCMLEILICLMNNYFLYDLNQLTIFTDL